MPKGLNRIEQMLGLIKQLPYCFNMFTENISDLLFMYWMIMQCVLMSRIQKELYMDIFLPSLAGYHCWYLNQRHTFAHSKKQKLWEFEMQLMLKWLEENITKIPPPSQHVMMFKTIKSWKLLQIDNERDSKSLFIMNTLDASEDFLVSDKLLVLIGNRMVKFWNDLILSKLIKILKQIIIKLTPPKGINRRGNIE